MRKSKYAVWGVSLTACCGRVALLPSAAAPLDDPGVDAGIVAADTGSKGEDILEKHKCTFKGFADSVSYPTTDPALFALVADLTGDGNPDLLVSESRASVPRLELLTNAGNGVFVRSAVSGASDNNLANLVAADFDGDGYLDLASQSSNDPSGISLKPGDGVLGIDRGARDGGFGSRRVTYPSPQTYGLLTVGDFDGDGWPDLAFAGNDFVEVVGGGLPAPMPAHFALSVFHNQGDGTFATPASYPNPYWFTDIATGDFNGDGHLDIAEITSVSTSEFGVFFNKGDGTFGSEVTFVTNPDTGAFGLGVADFDGDGIDDIATTTILNPNASDQTIVIQVFTGARDNSFYGPALYEIPALPSFPRVVTGDFDGDGRPDMAMVMPPDLRGGITVSIPVAVFENQGDGTFTKPLIYRLGGSSLDSGTAIATGDFNADGVTDIAVTTTDRAFTAPSRVEILLSRCE